MYTNPLDLTRHWNEWELVLFLLIARFSVTGGTQHPLQLLAERQ
jgi:hypothetical protein